MHDILPLGRDSLDAVMGLVERAIGRLDAMGIPQWDEIYPDGKTFARDIAEGRLYGLIVDGSLAGIVTLNGFQDAEYAAVDWAVDDPRPLVIHRVCVDPAFQGRGLSREIMAFAERHARENGNKTIRLDAFSLNPISLALYRSLGFAERGTVKFRKGNFICFEKELA